MSPTRRRNQRAHHHLANIGRAKSRAPQMSGIKPEGRCSRDWPCLPAAVRPSSKLAHLAGKLAHTLHCNGLLVSQPVAGGSPRSLPVGQAMSDN